MQNVNVVLIGYSSNCEAPVDLLISRGFVLYVGGDGDAFSCIKDNFDKSSIQNTLSIFETLFLLPVF